jgi:hypothetical protein
VPPTDRPLIDVSSLAPFVVVISEREAAVAVSLYGRLDATTVPEARDAVRRMDLSPGRLCLLDLQPSAASMPPESTSSSAWVSRRAVAAGPSPWSAGPTGPSAANWPPDASQNMSSSSTPRHSGVLARR